MCLGVAPLPLMKKSNIRRNTSIAAVTYAPYKKKNMTRNTSIRAVPYAPYETIQYKKKHVFRIPGSLLEKTCFLQKGPK